MARKNLIWSIVPLVVSSLAWASSNVRVEVVEEQEKRDTKMFCSKVSEQAAAKECENWLAEQKKTLGDRLLTAYCSSSEISAEQASSCLYRSVGDIKYVLRKYRTETQLGK